MRPYYSDDVVTLYHGDCREVLDWLAADVLAFDPPYGIGWRRGRWENNGLGKAHAGIANDGDTQARDWALSEWGNRPALLFGSLYAAFPADVRHILVWEKAPDAGMIGSTTGYRRDVEAVFLCGDWPKKNSSRGSVIRGAQSSVARTAGAVGHPHAKPVDVMCQLLERAPLGIVADPFAGSGSTLIAAKMLGRKAIGVELEEQYCDITAQRLAQGVLFTEGVA